MYDNELSKQHALSKQQSYTIFRIFRTKLLIDGGAIIIEGMISVLVRCGTVLGNDYNTLYLHTHNKITHRADILNQHS